ncbi:MAG: DEAD/DEAH box helicase family protein [Candidatus Parvarchaeum sp.]
MSFKDLKLKIAYNSDNDYILSDFFIPLLKESKYYKRVSAYYSSDSLKVMSEGLAAMLYNQGKVQLIISYLTNEDDYIAIKNVKKDPTLILNNTFITSKEDLQKLMEDDNVAALAYLLATDRLEIKFAICASTAGLFHLKFGLFVDYKGDYVGFSGSINETYSGLSTNIEEFKVFRSWIEEEKKYLDSDAEKFDSYWTNHLPNKEVIIVDLPDETKNKIINTFKKIGEGAVKKLQPMNLRPVQQRALDSWLSHNRMGLMEMATGSGKTIIGIYAILNLLELHKSDKLIVVIGCPTKALIKQWYSKLSEFYLDGCRKFIINETVNRDDLYERIKVAESGKIIIIGTYSTIHKAYFINEVLPDSGYKLCLIADEAHWLGAPKYSASLSNKFNYRLALTATPVREFDVEGTEKLVNYFGGVIYRYTLNRAINIDKVLAKYYYYLYFSNLNKAELREYIKLTKKYARYRHFPKRENGDISQIILALRAKIIKKAESKIITFRHILEKLAVEDKLNHLIIYCEDNEQIQEYLPILNELRIESRIVNDKTEESLRDSIIADFDNGQIECVLAMKIFDEGLDIPSALRGIFISSTSNPKQFIQRRGRLLRKYQGKKYAEIYDIIIAPDVQELEEGILDIETSIMEKEIRRALIFSRSAINAYECYKQLDSEGRRYNINVWPIVNEVESDE